MNILLFLQLKREMSNPRGGFNPTPGAMREADGFSHEA